MRSLGQPSGITLIIIGVVLIGFGVAVLDSVLRLDSFEAKSATAYLYFRWGLSLLAVACIGTLLYRARNSERPVVIEINSWLAVRTVIYAIFLAVVITTVADANGLFDDANFLLRRFFENALLASLTLWALTILGFPSLFASSPGQPWRFLDLAIWNLIIAAVLLEGGLSLWARYSYSPFFWNAGGVEANIERFRPKSHARHFNFTFNSAGYLDAEFFQAQENDFVVAILADSFGVGVVPYDYNFATIAERRLQEALGDKYERVAVHNFGIPSVGPPEYLYLLNTEVLETNPTLVVLVAFVGNDINGSKLRQKRLRASLRNWWTTTIGKRIWAVRGPEKDGAAVEMIGVPAQTGGLVPDFISDPTKEKPTFSDAKFLQIERDRMEVLNPGSRGMQKRYEDFFRALDLFESLLGDRLLLVLIPDEFQVNDTLYRRLLALTDEQSIYERDLPQKLIGAYTQRNGIRTLDLLPALRAAEKDGRTYTCATRIGTHGAIAWLGTRSPISSCTAWESPEAQNRSAS